MSWKTFTAPLRMPLEHGIQTNAPGLGPTGLQDFGTPRHSSQKVKVIHKEKLTTIKKNLCQGSDVGVSSSHMSTTSGATSRTETIPTAHVSPHPASRASSGYHHSTTDSISSLRRAASTNDFSDIGFSSTSPSSVDNYHKAGGTGAINGHTRRWSSYQNLQEKTPQHDFRELSFDPDPTLSESRFIDPEEHHNDYAGSKVRSQSHLSLTAVGGGSALNQNTKAADNMQYNGYTSLGKDPYGHHAGRSSVGAPDNMHSYGHERASLLNYVPGSTYSGTAPPPPRHPGGFATPVVSHGIGNGGGYGGHHPGVGASEYSDNFSSDITSWQQRHQEQLRRQHYEATQPQPPTSFQPTMSNGSTHSGLTSLLDPHKLDAVKRAADSIIREKDNIIDKQKVKILNLEKQSKESESDLHKVMFHKAQEESDALHFKLQEVQYESASLKAQLTEVMNSKGSSAIDLERQLGKTEYELRELKTTSERERQTRVTEMKSMQEMMAAKDKLLNEWKDKYMNQKSENEGLERKMDSLDRYLNDLPTADDHTKKSSEVRQLREEKAKYKGRCVELERRLEMSNKASRQKQEQLDETEETAIRQQQHIEKLQTELLRLREELGLGEGEEAPLGIREELEQVRLDNERLASDLEKARKLLEAKHKKQQAIEVRHRGDTKALEERLGQEESTVAGLKDELLTKDQHLKKLRFSVKELGSQNQDLMEKNMSLEETQRDLEKQLTGEAHKLEQRLLKEMAVCFAELQSLVQICVQRAEGQDPNISALFGVKGVMSLDPDDALPVGDNIQSLKYKVSKIHELRKDIDNLRELISNKYAEDMGENLNCTTQ